MLFLDCKTIFKFITRFGANSRFLFCMLVAVCAISPAAYSQEKNSQDKLLTFFSGQGCAVGPATTAAAIAIGFSPLEIDQLIKAAHNDRGSVFTGDWLVLSPAVCTIQIPKVNSQLQITDPEVAESFSSIDANEEYGELGCFLNRQMLMEKIRKTRNWSENEAYREYMRLLSASILAGDLAFYSEDALMTPAGFVLTTGSCANIPQLAGIKRNHALLIENFDAYWRASMQHSVCADKGAFMGVQPAEIIKNLSGGAVTNQWQFLEYVVIAVGLGWYEGATNTNPGTLRPPLCHYE